MKEKLIWKVLLFFFVTAFAFAQEKTITGTVKDEGGVPLPGVTVLVKGTTRGIATDFDGHYSIKAKQGDVLQFTNIGFTSVEKSVGSSSKIDVTMKEEAQQLGEVVLIGYGTQKKSEVTGAVASVKTEELQVKSVSSVELALQGKVSGVQVASTGGRAGDNTKISIRGNGSLSASNNPLYIIDGVQQESMGNLSAEDIESMEVLKDAASSAIYGSRASNGVVIISTKGGSYNGKPEFSFSSSVGIQDIIKRPSLLNATQYKQVHDAARENYQADITSGILAAPRDASVLTPMTDTGIDTNWLNYVLQSGVITNNQMSFTSGSNKSKIYLSLSHISQEGIIKQDEYQVARVRLNVEQKMSNSFKVGANSYFKYSSAVPVADDNNTYQPYGNALSTPPNLAPYAADGKINRFNYNNPLFAFERQVTDISQNVGSNVFAEFTPVKTLTLKTSFSGNILSERYNRYDAPNTRRGEDAGTPKGYGYYSTANNRDYLIENTVNYNELFANNKLKINVLVGQSFQRWEYEDSYVQGENFPSNDLRWLVSAGTINKGRSYFMAMSMASFFGRVQFNWDDRYNLMVSSRYDGSSKFTKENRWGSFPAVSAGWTISNESFFNVSFIDELKLRGSYGYTGNQSGINYASGRSLISSGENYNQSPGMAVTELFNPELHWEKGRSIDGGVDLSMFNKRLDISFDYYDKQTQDLLYRVPVAQESGYRTKLMNIGSIRNKGYEVSVNGKVIKTENFQWDLGANFSYNDNVVEKIGIPAGQYETSFTSIVKEGEPLGSFYLPEFLGIAQEKYEYKDATGAVVKTVQPGDAIYRDVNGDGEIDGNDKQVFNGGIAPIYGGLNTKFTYSIFDLSVNAQYSIGKKIYAMYKENQVSGASVGYPSFSPNMITEQMNYWTPQNTNTDVPRPHLSSEISSWNNLRSSRFLEDADYLRITDITLGVNLDVEKVPYIKSLRIYAQLRNPLTFTKYKGVDPEAYYVDQSSTENQSSADTSRISSGVDQGSIPNTKVYSLGLNINF